MVMKEISELIQFPNAVNNKFIDLTSFIVRH